MGSKKLNRRSQSNKKNAEKFQRQIQRLQIEMNFLKHVKKDEISKFALANTLSDLPEVRATKDPQEIEQVLKKRVLTRIANTNVMAKEITEFRKAFPDWEKELPKIFSVLGQKQRKKDQRKKEKDTEKDNVE